MDNIDLTFILFCFGSVLARSIIDDMTKTNPDTSTNIRKDFDAVLLTGKENRFKTFQKDERANKKKKCYYEW